MASSSNGHCPGNGAKVLPRRGKNNQEKLQLDRNAASRACQKDRQYIEKLETELSNCYQEIDYLQDQLNIRNIEANIMGEHIHGLELKLTELEKFPERVRVMDNDLMRSDSQCWLLMEEVQRKEEEMQKAALQIEKLESVTLDSQCEIESLKLDLTTLEQRLFDAESFGQHAAEYKAKIEKHLKEYELQLQEARKTIDHLEVENTQLKKEFLPRRVELREQKLKAKEDAEDLTQEMAELRLAPGNNHQSIKIRSARQEPCHLSKRKGHLSRLQSCRPRSSRRPATAANLIAPFFSGKMPVSAVAKQSSSKPNPFDSESDSEFTSKPAKASSSYSVDPGTKSRYKNGFHDSRGFENQSVQELESYTAHKAEETTQSVNDCLRLAENIKENVTNTLTTLHRQGEQINRTHETAANIDQDLSRSETLLGSLGGFFSKSWRPKKTRQIKGPVIITRGLYFHWAQTMLTFGVFCSLTLLLGEIDDSFRRRANHLEQREKLGLSSNPGGNLNPQKYPDPTNAMEKVQVEKDKQDSALSDLSDVLGQLKGMALDMGSEIDRQNKAMDALQDDVEELNYRVKGANQRARRLLGK
ncbi:hypothetical protein ACQ4PT_058323 [Festuca glaucescens]